MGNGEGVVWCGCNAVKVVTTGDRKALGLTW